ncbi:MAG: ribonuclease H family protein [Firmicutes bacterium]|nr:ribonuclease H family protein [Bacillota bacterium]
MKFYAVKKGLNPGIYNSWDEAKKEVIGYKGAIYKSFKTIEEAKAFMKDMPSEEKKVDIDEGEAICYVDGSYLEKDGKKSFSYGYIIIFDDEEYICSCRYNDKRYIQFRNVAGEVIGTIMAIKKAIDLGVKKIFIHHDYSGIRHWALKEWKANNELTMKYRDFFNTIEDKIEVVFIKVEAHTGVELNERVDKLAKDAKFKE